MIGKFRHIFSTSLRDGLDQNQKILFTALILTTLLVFLAENILLWDQHVLYESAKVFVPCAAILLVFYSVSSICSSIIIGLISIYLLLWLVPNLHSNYFNCAIYIIFIGAFFYALRNLRLSKVGLKNSVVMSLFSTMTIVGVAHPATSFDMFDRVVYGFVYKDTLFHASLAAMIKNYNVASTGLNGLIEVPYHNFSHHLYAALATLGNQAVIEVYGVATHVLFAPILIFSMASAAYTLSPKINKIKINWCLFSFLLALLPALLYKWGALWDQYFTSESYLVSLGLFILALALMNKRKLDSRDIIVLLISTAMITSAKATVGIILIGLYLGRVLFINRNIKEFFIAISMICIGVMLLYSVASSPGYGTETKISLLHFFKTESPWGGYVGDFEYLYKNEGRFSLSLFFIITGAFLTFIFLHFLVSWVAVWLTISGSKGRTYAYRHIYVLGSLAIGIAVILILGVAGGSAFYFTNVALFTSAIYVIPDLANMSDRLDWKVKKITLILIIIFLILVGWQGANFQSRFNKVRLELGGIMENEKLKSIEFINTMFALRDGAPLEVILSPDLKLLLSNSQRQFNAQPFMYPAISERPWVNVVRAPERFEDGGKHLNYWSYGYEVYGITPTQQNVNVPAKIPKGMKVESYKIYQ